MYQTMIRYNFQAYYNSKHWTIYQKIRQSINFITTIDFISFLNYNFNNYITRKMKYKLSLIL